MVSDITRMGEWSPVCVGGEWQSETRAQVRATFVGRNERGSVHWETVCRVLVARRGEEFAFGVLGKRGGLMMDEPAVRWGFTFHPASGGTVVEQSWELLPAGRASFAGDGAALAESFAQQAAEGMEVTLANLKHAAEIAAVKESRSTSEPTCGSLGPP